MLDPLRNPAGLSRLQANYLSLRHSITVSRSGGIELHTRPKDRIRACFRAHTEMGADLQGNATVKTWHRRGGSGNLTPLAPPCSFHAERLAPRTQRKSHASSIDQP
jgi:hypothetical protein